MKRWMLILLAVLMAFGTVSLAENMGEKTPEVILSRMSLREKLAQMMIPSFRIWKEVSEKEEKSGDEIPSVMITELNDPIREMLARDHFGGVILFGENFADAEQTLNLVADMQEANRSGGGLPLLIAVIQPAFDF